MHLRAKCLQGNTTEQDDYKGRPMIDKELGIYILVYFAGMALLVLTKGVAGAKISLALLLLSLAYILTGKFLGEGFQWIFIIAFIALFFWRSVSKKRINHRNDIGLK